jgi:hypothetical protein
VGLSFIGTAYSEPTLLKLASGFEAATKARIVPRFLSALPGVASGASGTEGESPPEPGSALREAPGTTGSA